MIDEQRPIKIFTDERVYVFPKGRNLLVSPVRWGKTTLLAKAARQLTATDNAICLFVSPNLNNLQEDWVDKHKALNLVDSLDLECCFLKKSYHTWTPDLLSDQPLTRIYSTNKHMKWLEELKQHLEALSLIKHKITKHLVFLVDEVHGIASDATANQLLKQCIDQMSELGTVIASTATPHRVIGREEWTNHINIEYPEGVLKPHETPLAELSDESIQLLRDQREIPQELINLINAHRQPGWNICPVVGQRQINWHKWFVAQMKRHYPEAEFLRISDGDYSLWQDGVEVSLKRVLDRKITSVQQAVDAITDHLFADRASLQLFVVGHAQIEEGQTHGNFSGTRFPTLQIIVPPRSPWNDKFAQWNRIEHRKATVQGITPYMITGAAWWTDYQISSNYMAGYSQALNDGKRWTEPLPQLHTLRQSEVEWGEFQMRVPTDLSSHQLCHDTLELHFEGAQQLIDAPARKRGGHRFKQLRDAAKRLAHEWGATEDSCRILYDDELESKFFYTPEPNREPIHILRHEHPDRAWVIVYHEPFDSSKHYRLHPSGKRYAAPQLLPPNSN
jgi:hypothetical protein